MIDPDLLAITRKRRQEGRCVACGGRPGHATLCKACATTQRYCSNCEAIWKLKHPRPCDTAEGRTSGWCPDCKRKAAKRTPQAVYLARIKNQPHPNLKAIINLYRAGLSYEAIASELQIPRGTLSAIIAHARATGRWPASLRRERTHQRTKASAQ